MYPKMVKHPNGYLVWSRLIPAANSVPPKPVAGLTPREIQQLTLEWMQHKPIVDPWRKRLLTDEDPGGWYFTISRNGELFEINGRQISGAYESLQNAMAAGIALADALPQLEPLP